MSGSTEYKDLLVPVKSPGEPFGRILPYGEVFFHTVRSLVNVEVWNLVAVEGLGKFRIAVAKDGSPLVFCEETGRWWHLDCGNLLAQAIAEGVARPMETAEGGGL